MALDAGPGFTGHATDVATGLTYMQQRYYDADIGRFISPDPVGPEEDFINHFNRYNYAQNNPVRYTDPDGRLPIFVPALIVYAVTALLHSDPANAPAPGETPISTSPAEAAADAVPGGKITSALKTGIKSVEKLSQRAATREAKRQVGIPTSQTAKSQTNGKASDGTPVGRQQSFEVSKSGGGTETKSVQISRDTVGKHEGMPQVEAGTVKANGQVDQAGRPRIQNEGKVRVDFNPNNK
jgi:RHS repeat-associated protein